MYLLFHIMGLQRRLILQPSLTLVLNIAGKFKHCYRYDLITRHCHTKKLVVVMSLIFSSTPAIDEQTGLSTSRLVLLS